LLICEVTIELGTFAKFNLTSQFIVLLDERVGQRPDSSLGLDTCHNLAFFEWLGDVVNTPNSEPLDDGFFVIVDGDEDDGDGGGGGIGFEPAAGFESIQASGHADVHKDECGLDALGDLNCDFACGDQEGVKTFGLEGAPEEFPIDRGVIHDQHFVRPPGR